MLIDSGIVVHVGASLYKTTAHFALLISNNYKLNDIYANRSVQYM